MPLSDRFFPPAKPYGFTETRRELPVMSRRTTRFLQKLKAIKRKTPIISSIHLNFICLHYAYIIGVSILGSIILYPGGKLSYIDALFFATGSATQSGLNPVDVNLLHTYQQVWLWLGSMIANPIVVHSFVVYIRLYWFERRFQRIVQDAKMLRRTRSRATSRAPETDDPSLAESGVRGRNIVVLRNEDGQAQGRLLEGPQIVPESTSNSNTTSGGDDFQQAAEADDRERTSEEDTRQSDNTFPGASTIRWAPQLDHERHIAFLENQRRDTGALWIPSPREYDRGGVPRAVEDADDGGELQRKWTSQSDRPGQKASASGNNQRITIDEPDIIRSRRASTFPRAPSRYSEQTRRGGDSSSASQQTRPRRGTLSSIFSRSRTQPPEMPYLSWTPTLGRNSAFIDLTESQRDELGGIEYRALKLLAKILIGYFLFFHLFGIVCMVPWIMNSEKYGNVVRAAGQGRPWWAVFISGSSFNDQGFSLTPDSLASFYDAIFPLLLLAFLIIIGNTAFPCMLRLIIWLLSVLAPKHGAVWEELHFLLHHPRRCFTLLFPGRATWWLFWVVVLLNGIDIIFFIVLDLNDPDVTRIPGGIRFVDGLFQAAATRTAGLSVISVSDVHPAVQVSYMIMMYISVYPIAISLRRTNVYEERSLGIYSNTDDEQQQDEDEPSYVGAHLRKQLSFDLWYIFLGLFIIAIVEGTRIDTDADCGFSMFAILFEIVSAYGTVGLSLGYPGTDTSFSAQLKTLSKLIIIAMQIRGRHRGLPYTLDRAVLLPSEALHQKEADDATKRFRRRSSAISTTSAVTGITPDGPFRPETGLTTGRQGGDAQNDAELTGSPQSPRAGAAYIPTRLSTHHEDE